MSALSRFEKFMENVVEDSVARLFRSPIQPAEIAKRLERAMESQQTISVKRVIVPNYYQVFLNPSDFGAFLSIQANVEQEMATYLRELAEERNFTMLEYPAVELAQDGAVASHTIQVIAEMRQVKPEGPTQVMSATAHLKVQPQASQRSQLILETPSGPHPFPLETTVLTLGRGLNNDIILEDARVSRRHARLHYKNRHFWLTDLGSTNGTLINGVRVNEIALNDGDVISLGGLEMIFREGAANA